MPNARGLETNPLALIQHLRHNLIDRYPRDSISKELLQNAEDAHASLVHFGWSQGLAAAHHRLLHGPALFALNNGPFSAQDAEAICQFGLNYKAVDRTSIGKFGLGLKSVFHLCEAFFYLSSTVPQGNDPPEIFNSIVNPWFGTAHHGDWNEFSAADQDLLRGHLSHLLSEPNWFCLWIPLRREVHCSGAAPIHKDFPGDVTTCPPDLLSEAGGIFLAEQLPLLRYINRISIWHHWSDLNSANAPLFVASVPVSASRSRFPDPLSDSVGASGKVSMQVRGSNSEMTYSLWQDWLSHLEEYRGRTAWPQSFSLANDGQPRPEKAEPHCAVSLIRRPLNGPGRLVVSTAVFLPLRGAVKDYPCEDEADYALKLHGCFFVDAGRGGPGEADDERSDEIRLKHEWNRRLLEEGVYPLLIPAVAELAATVAVSAAAIRGFTAAVEGSDAFRDSRQHICSAWHWAYRWRPAGLSWEKAQASLTVLEIPDPGDARPNLPGEALPRLARLSETYLLTPSGWPRLSNGPAAAWPAAALEAVLDADPRPLFEGGAHGWAYLRRFVEAAPPTSAGREGTEALATLLRRTFAGVRTRSLRERANDVRAVVRQLPPDRRVRVPLPANWSEADRQGFLAEPVGVVLVPAEFDPDDAPGAGQLDVEEAVRLLTVLQPPCQRSKTSGPARSILSAVHGGATAVLARCADLALWQGDLVTPDGAAQTVFSYARLAQAHQERRLFSGTAESAPPAMLLARACAALDVVLLPTDTAEALFSKRNIPLCEPPAMLAAFDAAPTLAAIDRRAALLQYLLSRFPDQADDSTWYRATRYLLHGRLEAIQESLPLYVGDRQDDGIWTKLARLALDGRGDGWRVIPPGCLTELLSEQHRRTLKVYGINADGVAQLLTEVRPESIEIDFGPQEQQQVIFGFREFPNLLKALPLHDGLDGRLHRIDARSYWKETWYSLEGPLGATVRLLRPCEKEHLAAIQRPLAPTLNPVEVLKLAAADSLLAYWETVLDALTKAGTLPSDLRATLATTEWLPLSGDKAAAPARVLYDPDLKDEVAAVLATAPLGSPVSPTALRADVRDHRGFAALVRHKLFPSRDQLLSRLGGALQPQERYHVGSLPFSGPDAMDEWLHAFRDASSDVMPVRDLLEHIHDVDPVLCRSHFIPNLTGDIDSARLQRVLAFLRDRHASPTATQLSKTLRVHNAYLRIAAADAAGFAKLLPLLRLLNRQGVWTPPTSLCAGVTGINPSETLDPDQEDILRHHVKVQRPKELKLAASNAGPTVGYNLLSEWHTAVWQLDSYFSRWAAASDDIGGWAGAFLSLLGDFEPLRKLAEKLLPRGRSPEYIRAAAGFRESTRKGSDGSTLTESPTRMLDLQRFLVEVTEPKPTIRVVNLLGEAFNARAASKTDDLLIGYGLRKLDVLLEGGLQVHWLHLRQIDPARTEPAELRRLLEGTADRILRQVYGQKDGSLRDVLTELCEGEQFGIRAAQAVLLEGAGHYLRQFGLTAPPALRDVLHQYDDAADRRAEERVAAEHGRRLEGETGEEKADRARRRLQELIETDHDVRTAILAAVRRKLGDYRYHTGSVLFELFQNADDAYVELQSKGDAVFAVATEQGNLTVMHAGRRINRPSGTGADDAGHARDLRKMLALGHSDKGIAPQGDQVTGRFGLGFKSVFLVSDQPQAVSGRLGFEVLAGVYPRPLGREPADRLRQRLHAAGFTPQDSTAFELSLRDGMAPDVALAPFCDLAHYLVMFARRVRRCVLAVAGQTTRDVSWSDDIVTAAVGTTQVATGTLRPIAAQVAAEPRQALVIRSPHGDLMFALNAQGFTRLPATVPTVWVTAPTQERHGLGWAVNGLFTLDVGRSQVDWTAAANRDLGAQLGTDIGEGFIALFDRVEKAWKDVVTQLRLAPTVTKQEFWESFWRTLSGTTAGPATLQSMIWEDRKSGAARLYADRPALPTGLGGERRLLTSLDQVEAILTGVMDAEGKSDLLSAAREFAGIRKRPLAAIVSERRVWSRLKTLSPGLAPDHPRIDLATLLADEIATQPKIDPDAAARYGCVATTALMREMDDGPPDQKAEAMRLREDALFRAQFRTRSGTWEPARRVLLAHGADSDELLTTAFAPDERVLASQYQGAGLDFFRACRGNVLPPRTEMTAWACQASAASQQVAVLRYMLQGLYGRELAHELKGRVANTEWLANLPNSRLLDPFDTRERYILLLLLDLLSTEPQQTGNGQELRPPDQAGKERQELQVRDFFFRLTAWWSENAAQLVARYERHTYYGGRAPDLSPNGPGDDPSERKKWLTLFLIGTFHTMGRAKADQHRSFLGLSEREGWLDLLAHPEPDIIGWLTAVRAYINKQTNRLPFYHWFKQALGVATIASHLEAYSQAFLAVNQWRRPFALTQITVPRASEIFQGTDIDAPPLAPILGMGCCFVMRELVRLGHIKGSHTHYHCFEPVEKVRKLLARLGCSSLETRDGYPWEMSKVIFDFLNEHCDDPTFQGGFDLPLLLWQANCVSLPLSPSADGDFVTLSDGRVIPRSYMR